MDNKAKYSDIVFLLFFGWLIGVTIFNHFNYSYVIPANNYAGFICWLLVISFKLKKYFKAEYGVLILLLLSTVNIISFTTATIFLGSSFSGFWFQGIYFAYPGINPLVILLSIIYYVVNWKFVNLLYKRLFNLSDEEFVKDYNRKVSFYYEKFSKYTVDDFNVVISDFKEYPLEAQEAINKIATERIAV